MNQTGWMKWLTFLAAFIGYSGLALADGQWKTLSKDSWRGYKRQDFPDKGWVIDQGAFKTIVGGQHVDLITKQMFHNFELELEWKVSPGGNGGIFYRAAETDPEIWHTAPEIQVLDDDKHGDGKNPKTSAGALYALIAPTGKKLRPVGEFNQFRLIVRDHHVEHWLNGLKIVEYELGSDALKVLIAQSKFRDMPRFGMEKEGYIGLQHHGQEVWYRNVRNSRAAVVRARDARRKIP
ncbi:MAG TPA: DUF1080 domain-containing protein [Terriglobia bacterium]|nr:DUF1080 domain-containing protein [Terriglobia bacterium]